MEPILSFEEPPESSSEDCSFKNNLLIERNLFDSRPDRPAIISPAKGTKFTLCERETFHEIFPSEEYLVELYTRGLIQLNHHFLVRQDRDGVIIYRQMIEKWLRWPQEELKILEKVGESIEDLKYYGLYYYHQLKSNRYRLDLRYRYLDSNTVYSVVLVAVPG